MNYPSPVRGIQSSKYNNYRSGATQQYEDEFWKEKANNMAETIDSLTIQNITLNKKIIHSARIQQELRQIIAGYEDDWKKRSRMLTSERNGEKFNEVYEDKSNITNQVGRLYKEIRVLKNTHDVELTKVLEENKKMKKIIGDYQSLEEQARDNISNLKVISKQDEQLKNLKRKIEADRKTISRLKEQKSQLAGDNERLRKDIQQIRIRQKIAKKQEEERLMDYTRKVDFMSEPRTALNESKFNSIPEQKIEEQESQAQESASPSMSDVATPTHILPSVTERDEAFKKLKETQDQLQATKHLLRQYQVKQDQFSKKIAFEEGNRINQKFSHQVKLKKLEGELMQAKTQLSDVLRKLTPLLDRRNQFSPGPESAEKRVGLSILELFLKKYKIQAF